MRLLGGGAFGRGVRGGERTIVTGSDGEEDLTNVHASNGSIGLSPRSAHPGLQPIGAGTGQHFVDADDMVWVGAHAEMETFLSGNLDEISTSSHGFSFGGRQVPYKGSRTYLLAQMRAASRASDDSCSYSLETMCTQSGNSSTLARLRPRSKIRILGSGTPRLNRDLGYG